ncbi:MAG TPA: hypothetical protein VFJ85_17415 [Acidimicrobiales bacterium]|nr:hypothetical protein [Acidimicrobiales bacterium]
MPVVDEIEEQARALEASPGFPAEEVDRIRRAASRLDPVDAVPGDVTGALAVLERRAAAGVVLPAISRRSPGGLARWAVVRLNLWAARYGAQQLAQVGSATVGLGVAVRERIEALEAEVDRLRAEVERLGAG